MAARLLSMRSSWTRCEVLPNERGKRQRERVVEVTTAPTTSNTASNKEEQKAHVVGATLNEEERATSEKVETRWWLTVGIGTYRLRALYDTGASRTVLGAVGLQIASSLGVSLIPAYGKGARVADGRCSPVVGYLDLPFDVAGIRKELRVAVMPELDADCYLGGNFIREFKAIFDPCTNTMTFKDEKAEVVLEVAAVNQIEALGLAAIGLADVSELEKEKVHQLVDRVLGDQQGKLGCTTWVEHEIDTGSARPIKQKYYPVSPKVEEWMHEKVKEMLDRDIIEPSNSPWSSPVVRVKKANGKFRFCIDFRKVNQVTKPDAYPLPRMESILRKLQQARYVSTLDLSDAYHQIKVKEDSRAQTAFTVPGMGLYQFKRLPFGLSQAPACFQRLIDRVIGPELEPFAFSYLDDIIIATNTFEEHLAVLERVFARIKEAGLTISREKSVFCKDEVKYLGVLVNRDGFRPDPEKVQPILDYPVPKNLKQLRRFMGMASWYRKFLNNFATIAEPLTRLTKKNYKYDWTDEQQASFELIKAMMASAPLLHRPHFNQTFIVQTDASDSGLGAVLLQVIDGEERVLEFASRVLTPAERNYSVTERECLAVIWAVQKFRQYVEGYEFKVVTDHSSLRWLCNLRNPTGRLARWALELQGYMYTVEHRKGALNYVPDALSRMYEDEDQDDPVVSALGEAAPTNDQWYLVRLEEVRAQPRDFPKWKLGGGQLYKYDPDPEVGEIESDDDAWKLVVPREQRLVVMKECHDDPTAGHLGREKTLARVKQYYYWPGLKKAVSEYVRSCQTCQQCKVEQRLPAGLMGTRAISAPWEVVAADITGPFPRSVKGYSYALIFEDLFTKWVECVPIRKANAPTILKALRERIILRFGTPKVFLSDNGTEFKNRLIGNYLKEAGIYHSTTPAYHPQANPVERVNRTMKTMIMSYVEGNHRSWDEKLPELVFAYNTAKQSTTGASPAFLNFGRQPTPPSSTKRKADVQSQEAEALELRQKQIEKLHGLQEKVVERARAAQLKQAKYYDASRRNTKFEVGDLVWKENKVLSSATEGITSKLAPRYAGPFLITAERGSNTYELLDGQGNPDGPIHVQQLKKYVERLEPEEEDDESAQPPGEEQPNETMSDPSQTCVAPPFAHGDSGSNEARPSAHGQTSSNRVGRPRGRPRKTVRVVRKERAETPARESDACEVEPEPAKRRGRPKGSKVVRIEEQGEPLSPRKTRAQRAKEGMK